MDDSQPDASGHEDAPDDAHDEAPEPSSTNNQVTIRRACDACRARKIRCNRESPCSYCTHAKIECTHADNKPKEKRTRILITPQYERKIDQIDRRLETVIRLLHDMKVNPSTGAINSNRVNGIIGTPQNEGASLFGQEIPSTSATTPSSHALQTDEEVNAVVEGEPSLAAHSVFANEFIQKVVNNKSLQDSSLDLGETLDALSQIVNALKQQPVAGEMTYPSARPVPRQRIQGLELPPIQKAVNTIRIAKSQRLTGMAWIYDFLPSRRFPDLCLNVYFSENHSEYDFITVNGGLHSLFTDYASQAGPEEKSEFLGYANMCKINLETTLSNLPLHLPASSDVIVALLFGTFHAVEISKLSLSWTLVSKASELCQTLGYHRAESLQNTKDDGKPVVHGMHWHQFLFWNVYCMDKALSLRLGRASTIPDWHITMPYPSLKEPVEDPIMPYYVFWIQTAKCQGMIYEMLYSPESMAQPYHVRQTRVHELVSMLHDIETKIQEANPKWKPRALELAEEALIDFFLTSDSVLRLSLLTLVYRAAPRVEGSPTTFSPECVKAARAALEKHQECVAVMRKSHEIYFASYIHWTVMFAPFIPFIVLFCQVIETQDQDDLARLHGFILFLQETTLLSDAVSKMYRLFQVLYSVALRFVEFRTSTPQAKEAQASAEMDAYLAALGFPAKGGNEHQQQQSHNMGFGQNVNNGPEMGQGHPMTGVVASAMDEGLRPGNPMMWMTNAAQLEDFFYSNQAMMDLLQEQNFESSHQT
ncbi:fungal specific transcription factor domain-containing protein [Colletotrichum truncatum]|uniref:Fungal specific transcription factor domain-containing protein n=1 Tax=Colletotrichum truncatum TaxID=5467 RepID=A0ACC3YLX7_COLTU